MEKAAVDESATGVANRDISLVNVRMAILVEAVGEKEAFAKHIEKRREEFVVGT